MVLQVLIKKNSGRNYLRIQAVILGVQGKSYRRETMMEVKVETFLSCRYDMLTAIYIVILGLNIYIR